MSTSTPKPEARSAPTGLSAVSRAWRWLKRALLLVVLAAVAIAALYLWAASRFTYSSGERAGYVQKFSNKGWLCKTWEGELAMANLPGAMPERFAFTVRDDAVAAEINKHLGSRVTLRYEQHLGLPSCFGETGYWVTGVRPVSAP